MYNKTAKPHLQLLFPKKQESEQYKITGLFIKNSGLVQGLEWWRTQDFLHSETSLMEIWFLLCHVIVPVQGRESFSSASGTCVSQSHLSIWASIQMEPLSAETKNASV